MPQVSIPRTPSVQEARTRLEKDDISEPTSWQLVQALLELHPEYGSGKAEKVRAGTAPSDLAKRPPDRWIEEVVELFDPELVERIHGRLLILGLARVDAKLRRHLEAEGFLGPLADEVKEDFESLLKPSLAGDQAYKGRFIKLLQNRPVGGTKQRTRGFVVVVEGGPGLRGLAALCHRQSWNSPLTWHYVVPSNDTVDAAMVEFLTDLRGVMEDDRATSGSFLPDPATDPRRWQKLGKELGGLVPSPDSADSPQFSQQAQQAEESGGVLADVMRVIGGQSVLSVGQRLVLLLEFGRRTASGAADPESYGLTPDLLTVLDSLPERVGIVLSGLPSAAMSRLEKIGATRIEIPTDRQLHRAQALSNDVPSGPDRLEIVAEVNALADAIALEEMSPPMVVGVMGGWGAGKSFVLHLISDRIREIRCQRVAPADDDAENGFPYVGHPYVIHFDAWTYAKGNLWASLMQQVFVELDRQIGLEQRLQTELGLEPTHETEVWRVLSRMTPGERDRLMKTDLGRKAIQIVSRFDSGEIAESRLWKVLEHLKEGEIRELKKAESQLDQKRVARDEARLELEELVNDKIRDATRRATWEAVGDEFLKELWERQPGKHGADAKPPTIEEITSTLKWYQRLEREMHSTGLGFVLFALAGVITAAAVQLPTGWAAALTTVVGVSGSVFSGLSKFRSWVTESAQAFEQAAAERQRLRTADREAMVQTAILRARAQEEARWPAPGTPPPEGSGEEAAAPEVAAPEATAPEGTEAAPELGPVSAEIMEKAVEFSRLDREFDEHEADVLTRRQRVGMTARHATLLDFVKQRLEGRVYEDKLGLLHQVKSDLEDLSQALLESSEARLFPRGAPRIILLIDDLDRCPPDKVVEVLEAAQLLVKTPLFVVVLAMDVRYVTRALEKEYEGVLSRLGEPSGLDYIEKIIQIPYRVRPVSQTAIRSFLWSQMSPEDPSAEGGGAAAAEPADSVDEQPGDDERRAAEESGGDGPTEAELRKGEEGSAPTARTYASELAVIPTRTLRFSVDEHDLITECCAAFEVSPRTMKRLVNVFKLLKIIWYHQPPDPVTGPSGGTGDGATPRPEYGPERGVKKAILALLVIAARFPEAMRPLLQAMERRYKDPNASPAENVVSFLKKQSEEHRRRAPVQEHWEGVEVALGNPALISSGLTFEQLHERHVHLVSTFSFVGESDPARELGLDPDVARPVTPEQATVNGGAAEAPKKTSRGQPRRSRSEGAAQPRSAG